MEIITNNPVWITLAEKLYETKAKIKHLAEIEADLERRLMIESNFEDKSLSGYSYKRVNIPGAIDYKSIPQLKNVNLEPFRKEGSSYWKLSFVKQFDI